MKTKNLLLLAFAAIMLESCAFSYSMNRDVKVETKSIDGVDYQFLADTEYKNVEIISAKNCRFTSKIYFNGMEKPINKTLSESDFGKKIDFNDIEKLAIDSVSFAINETKDKIDLLYYLDLGNKHKTVKFGLEKVGDDWNLN